MKNNHVIYCHTLEGKPYIGQTFGDNEKEWNRRFQNGNGYKGCTHFYNAIKKYGWENVKTEILFTGLSQEEANLREELLIRMYDTANPEVGYNITLGGSSNNRGKNCHSDDYWQRRYREMTEEEKDRYVANHKLWDSKPENKKKRVDANRRWLSKQTPEKLEEIRQRKKENARRWREEQRRRHGQE